MSGGLGDDLSLEEAIAPVGVTGALIEGREESRVEIGPLLLNEAGHLPRRGGPPSAPQCRGRGHQQPPRKQRQPRRR